MEGEKHRSRKGDAERKENYKRSDRELNRERGKGKDEEKSKDRDYRRSEKDRVSDKYKDSRHREKESRARHSDERERAKDKENDERSKLKGRIKDRDRKGLKVAGSDEERERDRGSDKKRRKRDEDSLRERSREGERERASDRYKDDNDERERASGRTRSRERERERNRDRHRHREEDDDDHGGIRSRESERSRGDRYKDDDEDGKSRKNVAGKRRKNEESDGEIDDKWNMEEEQTRLDEEMEKRRRRVQEWQELRRKKEELEEDKIVGEKNEGGPQSGKKWTLEGEESDDEAMPEAKANGDVSGLDGPQMARNENMQNGEDMEIDNVDVIANVEDEIDPLDAFMNALVVPEEEILNGKAENSLPVSGDQKEVKDGSFEGNRRQPKKGTIGRIIPGEDSDADYDEVGEDDGNLIDDEDDDEFMRRVKKTKVEKLSVVDHSLIKYPPFRKALYREVKEISLMTTEEVVAFRKHLELKIRGKDVPRPVKTWNQTGLTRNVLETIKKLGFEKPMPIQAQALPLIMNGRDCIGIAKTGSGKTLAFVLPMLRHIKDQLPLISGDGPIGLVMAPTRELVQQIHSDIKKFSKVLGFSCVAVYGGSGVAQQISELKRGAEIVVCTPGRMIDIFCTSAGKITNLRRVTYLVMDEADRMFDMGFGPQITKIVQNTRPDRQTVLFSATFPRQVEILARQVLNKPVEIQVGGRSVVNKDITQSIEVRSESERFLRLLELLGDDKYGKCKILVFVRSQEKCDKLFKDLFHHGHQCLSLHGAKDQTDRESTLSDFKSKSDPVNLLIATSVAARGLDVKELELVVNYDAPNHYEDYVHRVGRTGRAGRKGFAITFISEEEERYAPDLVKALELSEQPVPEDLKKLAVGFMAKVSQGTEHAHGTGYGGSGFKFNEEEEEARKAAKKAQARGYGFEEYDKSDSEDEDEGIRKAGGDIERAAAFAQAAALAAGTKASMTSTPLSLPNTGAPSSAGLSTGVVLGETWVGGAPNVVGLPGTTLPVSGLLSAFSVPNDAAARAQALAAALNLQHNLAKIQKDSMPEQYETELEINDFPQNARWKVTHKETLGPISEWTGAAITIRGQYHPPGKISGPGERKLYLFIEGPTESSVKKAKTELKRMLEDYTAQSFSLPGSIQPGKYSVL